MAEAEIEYRSAAVNSDIAVEFVAGIVVESAVLFVSEIPADIAAGTVVGIAAGIAADIGLAKDR